MQVICTPGRPIMQGTAALQGNHAVCQPARSRPLLPAVSPCVIRPAAFSSQRCHSLSQQRLITPAAATGASTTLGSSTWCRQISWSRQGHLSGLCRATGSDQQPTDASTSSSSNTSSSTTNSSQQSAGAAAAEAADTPLTVEAVQSDPAATIDAIQRLTAQPQDEASLVAAAAASASDSPQSGSAETSTSPSDQQEQQQPQNGFDALLAGIAAAWAGAQVQWQSFIGFCAAALAAVKASLAKFPARVAAQKLQKLQEAADAAPTDASKQAAYLAALNSNAHPR